MRTADRTARALLERIADGTHAVGSQLPSEQDLARELGVSRLTVREAVRALAIDGVIEVHQGRRNRVAPTSDWSVLSADVMAARARIDSGANSLLEELLEARLVLEVEIARLAATRITDEQLARMRAAIGEMTATLESDDPADVERNTAGDIAFHEVIVEAAGNAYLAGAFRPLREILGAVRLRTSAKSEVRHRALGWHQRILEALERRDPAATAEAMTGHMHQTSEAMKLITFL